MSQQLANHLKSYGRGEDTELVHMTKGEVKGLQDLAMAAGGSLTINPETGLAEAGFLKNLLPAIAGAGLMMIPGMQGIGAGYIGAGIGALEAARTGDIGRGLMAGLGAYGGAGLAGGLMGTAAGAAAPSATTGLSTAGGAGAGTAVTPTATGGLGAAPSTLGSISPTATGGAAGITAPTNALSFTPSTAASPFTAANAKFAMSAGAPMLNDALTPKPLDVPGEEDLGPNAGKYLSPDFQGYDPRRPNPYYRPTGLGYAEGGMIDPLERMAPGGLAAMQGMRDGYDAPQTMDGNIPQMANGGSIGGYSDGGRMLRGPGDGMSDDIPATIGNKQPARLADGEFVVPADVVSHLGNGSTDAGAKRLYSMMDNVRKARTGTKKQGKQIKPEKYMPVKKMAEGGATGSAGDSVVSPDALMGLADLSALGGMISNTRGPAARYTPVQAMDQIAAVRANRPVEPIVSLKEKETPETLSGLSRFFRGLSYNQEPAEYNPFSGLGGS